MGSNKSLFRDAADEVVAVTRPADPRVYTIAPPSGGYEGYDAPRYGLTYAGRYPCGQKTTIDPQYQTQWTIFLT